MPEKIDLRAEFWSASNSALLPRSVVAAALCHSLRWLIAQEEEGKVPARVRVGHRTLYRKSDVLDYWLRGEGGGE